jgi:hypothetical protein
MNTGNHNTWKRVLYLGLGTLVSFAISAFVGTIFVWHNGFISLLFATILLIWIVVYFAFID